MSPHGDLVQRGAGALRARHRARSRWRSFDAICERERCPFAVVGTRDRRRQLIVTRSGIRRQSPVDMPTRRAARQAAADDAATSTHVAERYRAVRRSTGIDLREAAYRVLRLPAVADKTFLITIGDRTVGGLTARDQMVGPWQVPVADVAVTSMGYRDVSPARRWRWASARRSR